MFRLEQLWACIPCGFSCHRRLKLNIAAWQLPHKILPTLGMPNRRAPTFRRDAERNSTMGSASAAVLLPGLALGRHHAVHAEVLDNLSIMVVAVPDHSDGELQTGKFTAAAGRSHLFSRILRGYGVDRAVRLGECRLEVVDHFLLGLDVLRTVLVIAAWRLLPHDDRAVRLKGIADMLELLSHSADRLRSFEISCDVGSGRRKIKFVLGHGLGRSHHLALDAVQLAVQNRSDGRRRTRRGLGGVRCTRLGLSNAHCATETTHNHENRNILVVLHSESPGGIWNRKAYHCGTNGQGRRRQRATRPGSSRAACTQPCPRRSKQWPAALRVRSFYGKTGCTRIPPKPKVPESGTATCGMDALGRAAAFEKSSLPPPEAQTAS